MIQDPSRVAARYWDREQARDLDGLLDCFADDSVFTTGSRQWVGIAAIRERYTQAFASSTALVVTTDPPIVEGNRAAIRWLGVFTPIEGDDYALVGVNLVTVVDERFTRVECFYDDDPLDPATAIAQWGQPS